MQQVLLVVQVLIAISLIGIILIQRSDTDGFGLGSGSGSNLLSGRATANLLTRATAILATLFFVNSMALSIFAARGGHKSLVEQIEQQENSTTPTPPVTKDTNPASAPENTLDLRKDANPAVDKAIQEKTGRAPAAPKPATDDEPAVPPAQ